MKVNLQMLKEDLRQLEVECHFTDDPWVFRCSHLQACTAQLSEFRDDIIYLIMGEHLPEEMKFTGCPSFICIGRPAPFWLNASCNLIYTEKKLSLLELYNLVSEALAKYGEWEAGLQDILDRKQPLQLMAKYSHRFIANPIFVQGPSFRMILYSLPDNMEETPELKNYREAFVRSLLADETIPTEDINALISDAEYNQAEKKTEPCIYSGELFGFRTLFYNIRIQEMPIARVCIDEIISPFNERDFALIKILGDYIKKGISPGRIYNFSRFARMDSVFRDLLENRSVSKEEVVQLLQDYGWDMEDLYVCLMLKLQTRENARAALEPLALYLEGMLTDACYLIDSDSVIFVCNLTKMRKTEDELLAFLCPILRDNLLAASVSMIFKRFDELHYYYSQAKELFQIGRKKDPTRWYFRFEDYHMDFLINKMLDKTVPGILIPRRLKVLMEYDQRKGTEYTTLLHVYLDHERNIADTSRYAYIHRNTCIYRLQRIHDLLQLDLDDPQIRLELQLAFQILDFVSD